MQIRAEEQEEIDKISISLNGMRSKDDPMGEVTKEDILKKVKGRYPEFPE